LASGEKPGGKEEGYGIQFLKKGGPPGREKSQEILPEEGGETYPRRRGWTPSLKKKKRSVRGGGC